MTKEDFFKMRDNQRQAGLIKEYQLDDYENNLLPDEEQRLLKALNNQKSGVYRTADLELCNLLCVEIYTGKQVECQRKKIDEVDNVTVWRIVK